MQWYIDVMEFGDTRDTLRMYEEIKVAYDKLIAKTDRQITNLRTKLIKAKEDKEVAISKLKYSQEKIIEPLIAECTQREKKLNEYRSLTDNMKKQLKIYTALLSLPSMCDLYRKACNSSFKDDDLKKLRKQAVLTLRQYQLNDDKTNNEQQLKIFAEKARETNQLIIEEESPSASPNRNYGSSEAIHKLSPKV